MSSDQKLLYEFLADQPLGVLSTINSKTRNPESALVAFAETENLEILFGTMRHARKYENLQKNPSVSFVTGLHSVKHLTLQYEGLAREAVGDEERIYKEILLHKDTPCTEEFLSHAEFKIFKIAPTWVALSDYTQKHPLITELKFS